MFALLASAVALAQSNPVPFINQPLVPMTAAPGGSGFTLTVNGTEFVSSSVVNWNGTALVTTFVTSSQLTASVPASDIAVPGTASVTVTNPAPGGGVSNVMYFDISTSVSTLTYASFYGFGGGPALLSADFNGDGKLDLAGLLQGISEVYVQLGNGDGSFQAPSTFAVGVVPVRLVAGDFNGDGKLDLAVANAQDGTVSVLLGNGDGTFGPQTTFGVNGPNSGDFFLVVGDFNGDGKLDLATGNNNSNGNDNSTVSVLLGNGDGTFQSPADYLVGGYMLGMAIGDFNGDGKLDIVCVRDLPTEISMLIGNGDGTFQTAAYTPIPIQASWLITADVNGDGKLDLVMTQDGSPGSVSVWLGNGDGTFQTASSFYTTGNSPVFVAAGDLNADGKLDLAVPNANSNTASVFLGNGDGTFQSKVDFPTDLSTISSTPLSVAVGDFNGDGRTDLAALNANDSAPYNLSLTMLLQGALPSAVAVPPMLAFAPQSVGTTSTPQIVTLTNTGTATLTLSSIGITGPNAADFAPSNNCPPTIAPNANCQISVTFTPTSVGNDSASLKIADNGPGSPQVVSLTGTSLVYLSPASVTFPSQYVGTSGLPQTVMLNNTGSAPLVITSVTATPGDFAPLSACGSSLAPGAICSIGVFFDPTTSGTRNGILTVTDSASNSPQTASLTGVGQDFSMAASSSSSATVSPGQTANYTVTVAPDGGFNQTVLLSCSGEPSGSSCSVSPSSAVLNGSTPTPITVSVITAGASASLAQPASFHPVSGSRLALWLSLCVLSGLVMLGRFGARSRNRRRLTHALAFACLFSLAITWSACGGGGNSGSGGSSSGATPRGTYNLTVTGSFTSGSTVLKHAVPLTLVVQ